VTDDLPEAPPTGEVMLTALAGLAACDQGLPLSQIAELGEEYPGFSFAGACALAQRFAEEIRALGGDPDKITRRAREWAYDMTPS
jgi:hypothetical protein